MRTPPIGLVLVVALGTWGVRADADPPKVEASPTPKLAATAMPVKFVTTTIKGEITVPSTFSSANYGNGPVALGQAGFGCGNLVIVANSKATKPRPPNFSGLWIDQPVWSHSVQATGTWSSGKCSYSLPVAGDQEFSLTAGTSGNFGCTSIDVTVTNTPAWQSVPKGTTKTDNITVSRVTCTVIG